MVVAYLVVYGGGVRLQIVWLAALRHSAACFADVFERSVTSVAWLLSVLGAVQIVHLGEAHIVLPLLQTEFSSQHVGGTEDLAAAARVLGLDRELALGFLYKGVILGREVLLFEGRSGLLSCKREPIRCVNLVPIHCVLLVPVFVRFYALLIIHHFLLTNLNVVFGIDINYYFVTCISVTSNDNICFCVACHCRFATKYFN